MPGVAHLNVESARSNMLQQQVRPWEVFDRRVLSTLEEVPREEFVPEAFRDLAFADICVPIGNGETMMEPKVEARMLQSLSIRPDDRILEIGTGSGFVTACLARLGRRVLSLDISQEFVNAARERCARLDIGNLSLECSNGIRPGILGEPFDVIAVTGSVPTKRLIRVLVNQLAPQGRLFAVIGTEPIMEATLFTRLQADQVREEQIFETSIAPLRDIEVPKSFEF